METRKSFHQELADLEHDVVRMAAHVSEGIAGATDAVLTHDRDRANAVIEADVIVDEACLRNEGLAYALLARQQPTAGDLRLVLTVLRLLHEIERCGDLVQHIAAAVLRAPVHEMTPAIRGIVTRMGAEAQLLLRTAVDAYIGRDAELAGKLEAMDDEADELHRRLLAELFTAHLDMDLTLELALLGRYYERIADHAVVIGDRVRYLVSGEL